MKNKLVTLSVTKGVYDKMRRQIVLLTGIILVFAIMCSAFPAAAQTVDNEKPISINFRDVPVRNAIDQLFLGRGLSYAFEPGVSGVVTLNLVDVPFNDALSAILKAANMTVRREKGIYTIGPIKDITTLDTGQVIEVPEIEKPKILEKIPIGYADVYDIGSVFGVQPISSRASSMTGSGGGSGFGSSGSSGFGNNNNSGSGSNFGSGGSGSSNFGSGSSSRSSSSRSSGSSIGGGSSMGSGITMPR